MVQARQDPGRPRPGMTPMRSAHIIALTACLAVLPACNEYATCEAQGGRMNVGMSGKGTCVPPTRDGDKPCRDQSDCEFACWAAEDAKPGEPAQGRCAGWPVQFGCHAAVIQGLAAPAKCVD